VQRLVEAVINALNHRHTDFLPRGELFIGSDFLDYHFPGHKGEMIKQLQQAAPSLGLSLVGVELNSEKSLPLLSSNAYKELQEYFIAGYVNGPISRLIEKYGFKKAMLSTRNDPSLFSRTWPVPMVSRRLCWPMTLPARMVSSSLRAILKM
jgi:hypothetical protein